MSDQGDSVSKIKNLITENLKGQDTTPTVVVTRNSLGWVSLYLSTAVFNNKDLSEREGLVDSWLQKIELNLGSYPFAKYTLLSPNEVDKTKQPRQLPLWSDILLAAEVESSSQTNGHISQQVENIEDEIKTPPLIVTFYSFKGGVGRSTALGMTANILATQKRRRVVIIDFDLEAPGISFLFNLERNQNETLRLGVLDYLHQRLLTPTLDEPKLSECIIQVPLHSRGDLFLVSAGEYDENYIHRLADFDLKALYQREKNPIEQLIDDIKSSLKPDVILIDARTGFSDIGAVTLLNLADMGIICFSPSEQSFKGLKWIVKAAREQSAKTGAPDIRFLVTPLPPTDYTQRQKWISSAENWIEENWKTSPGTVTEDLYSVIDYDPKIATLNNLAADIPESILVSYNPVVDWIDASLPDPKPLNNPQLTSEERSLILDELSKEFNAPTAQEMKSSDISEIFQRTEDFAKLLDEKVVLVRGAKGTGKSLLFRLFTEQNVTAKKLANSEGVNLENVYFVPGHGQARVNNLVLLSTDLESFETQVGEHKWQLFWLNYCLLQLCYAIPELRSLPGLENLASSSTSTHAEIVSWLVIRAISPEAAPKANDELSAINQWLDDQKSRAWVFYDELDAGFGSSPKDYSRRDRALNGLFVWSLENKQRLNCITPKIFLRDDIWKLLDFTNSGHYNGPSLILRWEEADLWRLVIRLASKSVRFRTRLADRFGKIVSSPDDIDDGQLPRILQMLWGERMGDKKAYSHNWVLTRITDSEKNRFPRSLVLLLQEATKREKRSNSPTGVANLLRPRSLIDALPFVSEQRVQEVYNEYPELKNYLEKLKNNRSPINIERLGSLWEKSEADLNDLIDKMTKAGIFELRPSDTEPLRYAIAELYLNGLGMVRKGQR